MTRSKYKNTQEYRMFQKWRAEQKKETPLDRLTNFMTEKGYKLLDTTKGTYTRKSDGKTLNILKAHFSNGKTYNVSKSTFWKEQ